MVQVPGLTGCLFYFGLFFLAVQLSFELRPPRQSSQMKKIKNKKNWEKKKIIFNNEIKIWTALRVGQIGEIFDT